MKELQTDGLDTRSDGDPTYNKPIGHQGDNVPGTGYAF